jgi:hypothetical protein
MKSKLLEIFDNYHDALPIATKVEAVVVNGAGNFHEKGITDPNNNYEHYLCGKFQCQCFWFPRNVVDEFEIAFGFKIKKIRGSYMPPNKHFMRHTDNHPDANADSHLYVLQGDGVFKLFLDDIPDSKPIFTVAGICDFQFNPAEVFHDYETRNETAKIINIQRA